MKRQAYNLVQSEPTKRRLDHTIDEYDYFVNDDFCDDPKLSDDEIENEISRSGVDIFCSDEKFEWKDLPDTRKLQSLTDWSKIHESYVLPVKTEIFNEEA